MTDVPIILPLIENGAPVVMTSVIGSPVPNRVDYTENPTVIEHADETVTQRPMPKTYADGTYLVPGQEEPNKIQCAICQQKHAKDGGPSPDIVHVQYDDACRCCKCTNFRQPVVTDKTIIQETILPSTTEKRSKVGSFWSEKQMKAMYAHLEMEADEAEEEREKAAKEEAIYRAKKKEMETLESRPETLSRISPEELYNIADMHQKKNPLRIDYVDPDRLELTQIIEDTFVKQFGLQHVQCHDDVRDAFLRKISPEEVPLLQYTGDDFITVRFRIRTPWDVLVHDVEPFWESRGYSPELIDALHEMYARYFRDHATEPLSVDQFAVLRKAGATDDILKTIPKVIEWVINESKRVIGVKQHTKLIKQGLSKEVISQITDILKPAWENGHLEKYETPIMIKGVPPLTNVPIVDDINGKISSFRFRFPLNGTDAETHQIVDLLVKVLLLRHTPPPNGKPDHCDNVIEYWYNIDKETGIHHLFLRWNTLAKFIEQFGHAPRKPFELKVDSYAEHIAQIVAKEQRLKK